MLWPLYLEYNFVGGMPKAVDTGVNGNKKKMNSLISNVRKVQTDIIKGYIRDFGKFSENKKLAIQIEAVFESVLMQRVREFDGPVNPISILRRNYSSGSKKWQTNSS